MLHEPRLFLNLYRPLGANPPNDVETLRTDMLGISPRATAIQWSTQLPGGYAAMTVGLSPANLQDERSRRVAMLERSVESQPQGHMTLTTGQGELWAGRRSKAHFATGRLAGIDGQGYGTATASRALLRNLPDLYVTSRGLLTYALLAAQPPFRIAPPQQFAEPGVSHLLSEYENQSPAQVIDQLTRMGGDANVVFDFTVYEGRVAAFVPRTTPTKPDYQIPYDGTVEESHDDEQLFSDVYATYTDTAGVAQTAAASDPTFFNRFGFTAARTVTGGQQSATFMAQFAETWLETHNDEWRALKVTRDLSRGLEVYGGGAERPWWYARAGEWCQVGGAAADVFIILRTAANPTAGTFEMELGQPDSGWASMLDGLLTTQNHQRRNTNPNSGAAA